MSETLITDWHGCYEGGWQGMIAAEAFAHPAKFSYALICRIVRHGLDQGYWKPGDTIGDPFGGVATGGIVCGYHGLNWVGCELEPRFVELGNKNLDMHRQSWSALKQPVYATLLKGDSRQFAQVVGAGCLSGVVSSPPYADTFNSDKQHDAEKGMEKRAETGGALCWGSNANGSRTADAYGASPGQIGALKSGSLDGVVTSPPFEASLSSGKLSDEMKAEMASRGHKPSASGESADYGSTDGQIGNDKGETYWQAMHAVYSSMYAAMKPGGVAGIVVKDYVKAKARVPLCDQTCTLLESIGFDVFERCRCWLVKERREPSLFGGEHVTKTERKSFFRRLAEKNGSPRIDWEEVIWCRK